MRPLTLSKPKPLVRVGGRPLIDYCLDGLAEAGVKTAIVNVHHLADALMTHLSGREAPEIVISDERGELLETGGGIRKALPLIGNAPFLLRNSDSFWLDGVRPNLRWLAGAWNDARMDGLLLLAATVRAVGYAGRGDFFLDREGRISRRAERAVAPFAYAGAAILHPRLFDGAPDGAFSLNLLFDKAIEAGRLFGVRMDGLWINVETPAAVAAAEAAIAASAA
jgi:MurNAc alpha-1-phosphate uridylyltransferase